VGRLFFLINDLMRMETHFTGDALRMASCVVGGNALSGTYYFPIHSPHFCREGRVADFGVFHARLSESMEKEI